MRTRTRKYEKTRRISALIILLFCICAAFVLQLGSRWSYDADHTSGFAPYAGVRMQESIYQNVLDYYLPVIGTKQEEQRSLSQVLADVVTGCFPVYTYAAQAENADRVTDVAAGEKQAFEAELEQQLALQLKEENEAWYTEESGADAQNAQKQSFLQLMQGSDLAGSGEKSLFSYATVKSGQVDLKELEDYQTLVKKHYCIDGTTASNAAQLNVKKLLKQDMMLAEDADGPQILIYHTHASEGYRDSEAGNLKQSVVGLGDYLTELLTERYGYQVLHDRGVYDTDRDRAYGVAGPALEQILSENPSIEVVIDLHRDGVAEDVCLLTEVNDTVMAPVMFFNGLSYTNTSGPVSALKNPYLSTNLAFSLQMELLASEYYPGFSRGIYLKGLRYNLHYCPKSLLVEVGAQTNSLQEAMNAMPPLADTLNRVLSGEKP